MSQSSYKRCDTCGDFGWIVGRNRHECPPEWEWRRADEGHDDWRTVRARWAEDAALKAAEIDDQEDFYLLRSAENAVTLLIRDPRTGEVSTWKANGESVPSYRVAEIKETEASA